MVFLKYVPGVRASANPCSLKMPHRGIFRALASSMQGITRLVSIAINLSCSDPVALDCMPMGRTRFCRHKL